MDKTSELIQIQKRPSSTRYSSSFKLAAIDKLLKNPHKPMSEVAKEMNVDRTTLWHWYDDYKRQILSIQAEEIPPFLSKEELTWVTETIGASKKDKVRYCRHYGIPYQKLLQWTELYKDGRFHDHSQEIEKMNKNNKNTIDKLKKENIDLKKKAAALEKALKAKEKESNAAWALVDLKKKVNQLLETSDLDEDPTPR